MLFEQYIRILALKMASPCREPALCQLHRRTFVSYAAPIEDYAALHFNQSVPRRFTAGSIRGLPDCARSQSVGSVRLHRRCFSVAA